MSTASPVIKLFLVATPLIVFSTGCTAQQKLSEMFPDVPPLLGLPRLSQPDLFPIAVSEKVGYINREGNIVINPQFIQASTFSEGLAAIRLGEKWGFIDSNGEIIINPQFDLVKDFSDGMAPVQVGNKWGYIDMRGKLVINPQFDEVDRFAEGMAPIRRGEKWGFIDKGGKNVIEPQFDKAWLFQEGLAGIRIGERIGFVDRKGKIVINPQFEDARAFSEGLAAVRMDGKWGFIDKSGQTMLNPEYDSGSWFTEGMAPVRIGDKWGFIDKEGSFVVTPQFDSAGLFSEARAPVLLDEKWGFIDKEGRIVINPQFDGVVSLSEGRVFNNGLAKVVYRGSTTGQSRLGYINPAGEMVWLSEPIQTAAQNLSSRQKLAFLTGTWEGHYYCGQGLTNLRLEVEAKSANNISAIFNFSAHPDNPGVPAGSFRMAGFLHGSDQLILKGDQWLRQPRNFRTVDLQGTVDYGDNRIRGRVTTQSCDTFELARLGQRLPSFIAF